MGKYFNVDVLDNDKKQIIEYVSSDEMYVCTASRADASRYDYCWQIKKVYNTDSERPIVLFANRSSEYIFRQVDWNNAEAISYIDD